MPELLQQWVTAQAESRPEAIALAMGEEQMSYGHLEQLSNQLAGVLKDTGCRKGDRICFVMPKSPIAIATILGILKADCIYVPIDPSGPPPRVAKSVESCGSRLILAAGPVDKLLAEVLQDASCSIGWLDTEYLAGKQFEPVFSRKDLESYSSSPPEYRNAKEDAAYILFTSGSTGIPKGVPITHSNVIHYVEWANDYFGVGPSDRISGHPPLYFDLSTYDVFGALAAGAQLQLIPPELNLLPTKLAQLIRTTELTQWFSVPSALSYMAKFDVVEFNDFPSLRRVLWCGEVLPTPTLIYWMKRLPAVRFTNLYGPTEATIASSYYTVPACPDDETAPIPIGTPCPGEELLVLDEELRPVPRGEIGDLYIGGVGLSPGYWMDPEKTQSVFLQNPFNSDSSDRIYKTGDLAKVADDGLVYFLGRADSQIKSRGYRIELGEIEAALNGVHFLDQSAVVAVDTGGFEGVTICCAFVPSTGISVSLIELRKELAKVLPNYMLPARWMSLEKLPQTSNGKIDRGTIKEKFQRNEAPTD